MKPPLRTLVLWAFAWSVLTLGAGCGSQPASEPTATEKGDARSAALAKLAPADREAAKEQAVCPVSDEALGTMGAPVKVVHDGQEVFLCCEGCREDFEKDPQAMLAKLKK